MEFVTKPMRIPIPLATSKTVFGMVPSSQVPIEPFLALQPLANAVPAAAESVERESAEWVVKRPREPSPMILSEMIKPSL